MKRKVIRLYVVVFTFLLLLNFFLPRLMPGGPVEFIEGQDSGAMLTEEQKAAMEAYYQLDDSLLTQFITYIKGVFTLDFGTSFTYKSDVMEVISHHFMYTWLIVGFATVLSFLIGIISGLWSAWFHHEKSDRGLLTVMLSLGALPEFLIAIVLLLAFSVYVPLFPLGGAETPFLVEANWFDKTKDFLWHAFLPTVTLTIVHISSTYLLVRNETIQVMKASYIEFAKMKGLSRKRLMYRHIAKNSLLTLFTLLMIRMGLLFTGAIFVEVVYSYPGIGKLLQEAILSRDYPLMHGLFFIFSTIILCLNAMADWLYPKLDPRLKGGKAYADNI
ncbi:ABC transporter permease [Bacillaceae bacterium SAS-127]|nr:ABC transporter permease [Bacillaceae bacterium SAS-127]